MTNINSTQRKILCLLGFMLLIVFGNSIVAQTTSLLTEQKISKESLSATQSSLYQKLESSGGYVTTDVKFTSMAPLATAAASGRIKLAIGGLDLSFEGVNITYNSEADYQWYGKTPSGDDLLLISNSGAIIGSATVGADQYELHSLTNGIFAWLKIKKDAFPSQECGVPTGSIGGSDGVQEDVADMDCNIRVLVVYTQAAENATPNMSSRINLAISQTNQAFSNSQVTASTANLVLVHQQKVSFFSESDDIQLDIANLSSNPTIQALRNQYYADIVVLLTNGQYDGVYGIVDEIGPNNAHAYAIVQTNAATSVNFTFAHEVGHLFGCLHNNDTHGTYEHGYNFQVEGLKKTIMNVLYDPPGGSRILNYSNPDVKFNGIPTGTASKNNNARKIRSTGCAVAGFRGEPGPPPFIATITGSWSGCACSAIPYTVNLSGGVAPFTYEWQTSTNGINWSPVVGTAKSFTIQIPCNPQMPFYWIKVKVKSSNGQMTQSIKKIVITPC